MTDRILCIQIIFTATKGSAVAGNIGLDNVRVTDGVCLPDGRGN